MKPKTISKVISSKFNEWIATIEDENVRKLVKTNSIVTGGCIASMLLQEEVKDFDVYFKNKETAFAVAQYYVMQFLKTAKLKSGVAPVTIEVQDKNDRVKIKIKSAGIAGEKSSENVYQYFEQHVPNTGQEYVENVASALETVKKEEPGKKEYKVLFLSANAITLTDKIQIIIRFFGEHDEIHGNYDFVHCTNYWQSNDAVLHLNQPALEALLSKELVYVGSKFPICSIIRTRKFIKRNWTINAGQMLKMAYQIGKLDLDDFNVLEDQLTGVDVAYFHQLIDALKEHADSLEKKGEKFKLEYGYLAEIIDRIF